MFDWVSGGTVGFDYRYSWLLKNTSLNYVGSLLGRFFPPNKNAAGPPGFTSLDSTNQGDWNSIFIHSWEFLVCIFLCCCKRDLSIHRFWCLGAGGGGGGLDPILRVRSYTGVSTRVDALHTHISVCWLIQGLPSIFYLSFYIPEFLFWLYFYWMDFVFKYFFPLQEWLVGALFSYFFKCSLCLYLQYA